MGIISGLKDMQKKVESSSGSSDSVKATWVTLADGQKVKLRFLQELDADSPNYDQSLGLGFIAVEHSNPAPNMWSRKALCSIEDQGRCYGCERNAAEPKTGWGQKSRLYINVLVDDGKKEPYVAILSQSTGAKSAAAGILEYAVEMGTITDVTWKLSRAGASKETSYSIIPLPSKEPLPSISDVTLFDLHKSAVRDIAYADQETFYLGAPASHAESASPTSVSEDW